MQSFEGPVYEYDPLPEKTSQIRVLEVLQGESDDAIVCTLELHTLHRSSKDIESRGLRKAAGLQNGYAGAEPKTYEALSWTWGDDTESGKIMIEKREHGSIQRYVKRISPNLMNALKHFRYPNKSRTLWVDQVCVNQGNNRERNRQVAMMSDIYSQACNVCIWLGEHADASEEALTFIDQKLTKLGAFKEITEKEAYQSQWKALAALMTRPWFSRRWVVQEISLATQATVHCGNSQVKWTDFETAVALFDRDAARINKLYQYKTSGNEEPDPNLLGDVGAMGATRLVKAKSDLFRRDDDGTILDYRFNLGELVANLSAFEAQKPHDIFYAILALAKDTRAYTTATTEQTTEARPSTPAEDFRGDTPPRSATPDGAHRVESWDSAESFLRAIPGTFPTDSLEQADKPLRVKASAERERVLQLKVIEKMKLSLRPKNMRIFQVDYDQDFFSVCKQFLTFAIPKGGSHNLDILCRPWAPRRLLKLLPSWIPNVTIAPFSRRPADYGPAGFQTTRKNFDPLVGLTASATSYYNACKGVEQARDEDWGFGDDQNQTLFVTGFVLDRIGVIESPSPKGDIPPEWFELAGWDPWSREETVPPERLWRTLVADRGEDGKNTKVYYPRALQFAAEYSTPENGLETTTLLNRQNPILIEFLSRMQAVIFNRRLFKSERDGYLGLAPKAAREGDYICIVRGCSVPVLLRKQGDYYTAVGQSYVHTMMDGKAIEVQVARSAELQRRKDNGLPFGEQEIREGAEINYHMFELR